MTDEGAYRRTVASPGLSHDVVEAELADANPRPQFDRYLANVRELHGQATGESRMDDRGCGDDEPATPPTGLSDDVRTEIRRHPDPLQRDAEHELSGMEHVGPSER